MRFTFALGLTLLAASVSGMTIGRAGNELAHRRHGAGVTHNSVFQARKNVPEVVERNDEVSPHLRKRGLNYRRCKPKANNSTSLAAPSKTVTLKATVDVTTPIASSAPDSEPTSSRAQPITTPEPQYTKVPKMTTKTSTSAEPMTTPGGSSSYGETFTGEGTYYGTGLGACGITNQDTDFICAVSHLLFDGFEGYNGGDPNSNPVCNRKIKATYQGKSVTVTVTDRCVGCAKNDLDFSPSAFDQIADRSIGRLTGLTWTWAN